MECVTAPIKVPRSSCVCPEISRPVIAVYVLCCRISILFCRCDVYNKVLQTPEQDLKLIESLNDEFGKPTKFNRAVNNGHIWVWRRKYIDID